MRRLRPLLLLPLLIAALLVPRLRVPMSAESNGAPAAAPRSASRPIRVGVLLDHTGPLAGAGALAAWRGTKIAIDLVNTRGGVLGRYPVVRVDGDARSSVDLALDEAERLLAIEQVDVLTGLYSSAQAGAVAAMADRRARFVWITAAASDAVLLDRGLRYVFRPQPSAGLHGATAIDYVAAFSRDRLDRAPRELRVAIIHEDDRYASEVARGNEARVLALGLGLTLRERYAPGGGDLSWLVTSLRAARPDVVFHTGYHPGVARFLAEAKTQGFQMSVYVGHGAGHSQLDRLKEAFGDDVEGFHSVEPIAAQLVPAAGLGRASRAAVAEMLGRYRREFGEGPVPAHVSIGFNSTWILLTDVLPRAISTHGGVSADALARAARETDIPEGGTVQGFGVKFHLPGHRMAGQNERGYPAVLQVVRGRFEPVYPGRVARVEPALRLGPLSAFLAR